MEIIIVLILGFPAAYFGYMKFFKQKDEEIDARKKSPEYFMRKADIKPEFMNDGGSTTATDITISLRNGDNKAKYVGVLNVSTPNLAFTKHLSERTVMKHQVIEIYMKVIDFSKSAVHASKAPYVVQLKYEDIDGNKYIQDIRGTGATYRLSDPKESV